MDKVFVDHIGAVDFRVDLGDFTQCVHAGLGEEGHEAELDAVFFEEEVFVFAAQRHHLGHVDLVVGGEHGGGVLAVFEAFGDGLAQTRHFHAFFAWAIIGGAGRARSGGRGRSGGRIEHVFFHHAAIFAGAFYVGQALFGHEFVGGRRVLDVFFGGSGRRGRCLGLGFFFCGGGCSGGTGFADLREQGIDADGFALGGDDFGERARHGGGHFDGDFVGL